MTNLRCGCKCTSLAEQPALTLAQSYMLPLFSPLSHLECRQEQLSYTSSKKLEISPSQRPPAPSEVLVAPCSQTAWELLPRPSTTRTRAHSRAACSAAGSSSRGQLVTHGTPWAHGMDAARKKDACLQSLGRPVVNPCCAQKPDPTEQLCIS